jgi:hypothetical protein
VSEKIDVHHVYTLRVPEELAKPLRDFAKDQKQKVESVILDLIRANIQTGI